MATGIVEPIITRSLAGLTAKGVVFVREPKDEIYGMVAVFRDLYGNLWDLIQRNTA